MRRLWSIAATQVRVNLARLMAYRTTFLLEAILAPAWLLFSLFPLLVLFDKRDTVAGWDEASALMVVAYFTAVRAVLNGIVTPALVELVNAIRSGAFDYALLKPVDAQFLATTSRQEPWSIFDLLASIGLAIYAFHLRGYGPAPLDVVAGLVLLLVGCAATYSLWMLAASAAFWVVKIDNLQFLLSAVFDTGRWPVQVFRGAWRIVFTFVIPVAVITTFPAMALLGRLDAPTAAATIGGTALMLILSRLVWRLAIRNYTSASS